MNYFLFHDFMIFFSLNIQLILVFSLIELKIMKSLLSYFLWLIFLPKKIYSVREKSLSLEKKIPKVLKAFHEFPRFSKICLRVRLAFMGRIISPRREFFRFIFSRQCFTLRWIRIQFYRPWFSFINPQLIFFCEH